MGNALKKLLSRINETKQSVISENSHLNIVKQDELIPLPRAHLVPTSAREDYL